MQQLEGWADLPITEDHARYLAAQAVTPGIAKAIGVWSATEVDQLPEELRHHGEPAVPAIVFPWTEPGGDIFNQIRPDQPITIGADVAKYVFAKGRAAKIGVVRDDPAAETVLIVEGTKQSLAAAAYAPEGVAVYGIAGCRMWSTDGIPTPHLRVCRDRDVVILLDADAARNLEVYEAGANLAQAIEAEGAESVRFARLAAGAKAGLDDVLGQREEDSRRVLVKNLIAKAKAKPADSKPKPKKTAKTRPTVTADRGVVNVDGDRLDVINAITAALLARWNESRLFSHGEVISQLRGCEMRPLTKGVFLDLLQETTATVKRVGEGDDEVIIHTWPDTQTVEAVMSRSGRFARLDRIARAPFIRPDGTVCQANGYDDTTGTMVVMDDGLSEIVIPDDPTPEQISAARELLMTEWLGDLPFHSDADSSNALALLLTPFVRGHMDLVPLAVVDGLQMGVGKNLFADCVCILSTGSKAEPLGWTRDDEETRKLITSAFRTGADIFCFDEAHHLDGAALARALTSSTYKDRQLGVSQMLGFPNRVTWMSLGNQVRVEGDITRRVYRIALRPTAPNPQDRRAETFRHPELRDWTIANRPALLTAALTLIRAWFAAGSPAPSRGVSFGSFERWERTLGGIVEYAGLCGFLDNLAEWRSETSFETAYWIQHVGWLWETFRDKPFSCAEARDAMARDPRSEPPPGLTDLSQNPRDYNRSLGQAYARMTDRYFGDVRLVKLPVGKRGKVVAWKVIGPDETPQPEASPSPDMPDLWEGAEGWEGTPDANHTREKTYYPRNESPRDYSSGGDVCISRGGEGSRVPSQPSAPSDEPRTPTYQATDVEAFGETGSVSIPVGVVVFDLETGSADQLFSSGPEFVRIAGIQVGSEIRATTDIESLAFELSAPETTRIVGHNILGYDLVALARHHGLDLHKLTAEGRVVDTMLTEILTNPPEGGQKPEQVLRAYSLDRLAEAKFGQKKTDGLKRLAKEFGGFDQIPVDHPDYLAYLAQDVRLTAQLAKGQTRNAYIRREHQVAAIAAQIRSNGFRVDVPALTERVEAGHARRAELVAELTTRYDLPTLNAAGKPVKAPHATKEGRAKLVAGFQALGVALPKTSGGEYALGKDVLAEVGAKFAGRPEVVELVEMVQALNGIRTVFDTVERYRVGDRVHPDITMLQASGRWSTTKPGLTVMGKRGGRVTEREIFLPESGHVIIAADLAQVDARAVAAWCQDPGYMDLFEPGRDSHAEIALRVWGDPARRQDAKVIGHGWNYGMGLTKLGEACGSIETAREYDRAMRESFPGLVAWKREVYERGQSGELLDNGFGRKLRVNPDRAWTQAPALMGQSAARDLMMEGLLRLPAECLPMLRAVVHDEIVMSVPAEVVEDVKKTVVEALSFEWAPPGAERSIRIEAGCDGPADNWGAVYEK